jgi:basic membrane protein A
MNTARRTFFRHALLLALVAATGLLACPQSLFSAPKKQLGIVLVLAAGGLGDKSYNDNAYAGLLRSQKELGAAIRVQEYLGATRKEDSLRQVAEESPDLVITVGPEYAGPIKTVAAEFPDLRFACLDARVEAPNVASITFREIEGDFLAGALTALMGGGKPVAFLGGCPDAALSRIQNGWTQGVRYISPKAGIIIQYLGEKNDYSAFRKPELGKESARNLFARDVGVMYVAAGGSGLGAIDAARESGKLVITTSIDQRWIAPAVVVSSRTKNLDAALFMLAKSAQDGSFRPGVQVLDFAKGGIGLSPLNGEGLPDGTKAIVPAEVQKRMAQIQQDLLAGKIRLEEPAAQ